MACQNKQPPPSQQVKQKENCTLKMPRGFFFFSLLTTMVLENEYGDPH